TRRGVIGAAASAAALPSAWGAETAWTLSAYETAMRASGRPVTLTDAQFDAIQKRKPAAMQRIADYLKHHFGSADPLVMAAFQAVPREYFHYIYSEHRATPGDAYEETPKPWALGYGSALSDYLGQAYMTQVCKPQPGEVTLEIGTGSGFQSSLLSRIVKTAYSIEIIEPLGKAVSRIFAPLGYNNIHTKVGDGYYGWPEVEGGFDIIIVTCAATFAPPDLFKQLKPGGRMIIPIGQPFKRGQVLYVYTKDAEGKIHSRRDIGVFFIPMTGAIQKHQPQRPETVSDQQPQATKPAAAPAPQGDAAASAATQTVTTPSAPAQSESAAPKTEPAAPAAAAPGGGQQPDQH
ncbi:MAG TPA: protein-L-isoaspartate O-methyltransferase, partial [Rhodopila sp.]|nr:protein-L-isoaspartate O-methyltransferase [Rhodopila sp.]